MTEHIQQPPNSVLCGQCCVAMALGITLDEAIALVGTKGKTRNKVVIPALGAMAMRPTFRRGHAGLRFAPRALVRVRWDEGTYGRPKYGFHLAFKDAELIHDPAYSKPAPSLDAWLNHLALVNGKVMGWLPLRTLEMAFLSSARVLGGANR